MEKSIFKQYIDKWFLPIISAVVELYNGKEMEPTYLFKSMLRKEFSPTLKWGSLSSDGRTVLADIVAMDTSLPLKKRSSIKRAEGDIPKLGMKLYLNEKTMSEINILNLRNDREADIVKKLFQDSKKCYVGVLEQLEYMFHQALSSGFTAISDTENVGQGIRLDFQHPDDNKFGTVKPWSDTDATPIDDIENVIERAKANGHNIMYIMMDRTTYNYFRSRADVRALYGSSIGFYGTNPPRPTLEQLNETLNANYQISIQVIDRTFTRERDGVQTLMKGWTEGAVVFTTSMDMGTLTYGELAEQTHPVEGVSYELVEDFILLSKYRKNDPLREFSSSQALAVPVLNNLQSLYIMNSEESEQDAQTEGDADFSYEGTDYTRVSVVDAINKANPELGAKISHVDSTLQKKVNKLSDEEIEVFEANIVASV
jgi:hypothetical protein